MKGAILAVRLVRQGGPCLDCRLGCGRVRAQVSGAVYDASGCSAYTKWGYMISRFVLSLQFKVLRRLACTDFCWNNLRSTGCLVLSAVLPSRNAISFFFLLLFSCF